MATTIVLLSVGREWAAVTTEGLLVYSLDNINIFDPFDLEISITPATIRETIKVGFSSVVRMR